MGDRGNGGSGGRSRPVSNRLLMKNASPSTTMAPPTPIAAPGSPPAKPISTRSARPLPMMMMPAPRKRDGDLRMITVSCRAIARSNPRGSASGAGTRPRSIIAMRSRISSSRTRERDTVLTIRNRTPPTMAVIGIRKMTIGMTNGLISSTATPSSQVPENLIRTN
jgi:hypothetical protein